MEQPPGSLDDLQPQDLSTSSITTVIDLTRTGEECVLNPTSLNSLRKSPGWYPNSGTSNPGLMFSERASSSNIPLQSGDQIHPDNAFSHTTVTLSYVSRSQFFTTHDSLSQHSALRGMPAISKLPLHSPCDSDEGLGETGFELNQHYSDQADRPADLPTQMELFQLSSQDQVGPESDHQEPCEVNKGVISCLWNVDKQDQGEPLIAASREKCRGLENGRGDSQTSSGFCAESSPESLTTATGEDEEERDCEVLFVISKKPESLGAKELCSLNREYGSPLEDPVSTSATSQDDVEDVFILPQASSSPNGDSSYVDLTDEDVWDGASPDGVHQLCSKLNGEGNMALESSDGNEQPIQREKSVLGPVIDLTEDVCVSDDLENKTASAHMNGNAKALQRTFIEKKLPVRSGRGTRLEAIVMNINSSRYEVSGCICTKKKANASQSTASEAKLASTMSNNKLSLGKRTSREKASLLVNTVKQTAVTPVKGGNTNNIKTDSYRNSTSNSKTPQSSTPPKSPQFVVKKSKKQPEQLSNADPAVGRVLPKTPSPKSPKKGQGKTKLKAVDNEASPSTKKTARKSQQKKHKQKHLASLFSPREPEIKLRYINYKEEKRDSRLDSFSPFVHVEHQQSSTSLCTLVNYPEEARTQHKKGQQASLGGFITPTVPSTSCLHLGRASTRGQHQRSLVCCLCGQSANAMDLGDLHGPYYPEGYQPTTKTPASMSGLKEDEDNSYSDSSACSFRDEKRKNADQHKSHCLRSGAQQWTSDGTGSPVAKRARLIAGSADVEDWYSPPMLRLDPCEYWLHEDCGIWSAGVFLVKGKIYGLEEAVKVAQETVTMHFNTSCYYVEMYVLQPCNKTLFPPNIYPKEVISSRSTCGLSGLF